MFGLTGATWGIIGSWVAVGLIIGTLCDKFYKTQKRKRELADPFDVYYEPDIDQPINSYQINAAETIQQIRVTLRIKTSLNVRFASVRFYGEGDQPKITNLYDWNWGVGAKAGYIDDHGTIDGSWYWEYHDPFPRYKNSRIKIGIQLYARGAFKGNLGVGLTHLEREVENQGMEKLMPFQVVVNE